MKLYLAAVMSSLLCVLATGCVVEPVKQANTNSNVPATPQPSASVSPETGNQKVSQAQPVTMPVLDAFLTDSSFVDLAKSRVHLTDAEVDSLKDAARSETIKLREDNSGTQLGESADARKAAKEKIETLIGAEKAQQLEALIAEHWSGDAEARASSASAAGLNNVPTDSRIVVNSPAYRMDVFENGRLIKTYKIGIGYPQFPLPTGLRKARVIIFNPTWTPPDEPWVAKMKNVSVGEKVEAGSKLNPLGPVKIPIGGPSLIHGGKPLAKLGTFASHGCVGLTTAQVHDFAKVLAQLGGAHLTDANIAAYERTKTETKELKLSNAIPVELRYETLLIEDGKLHIYRDVYDQGTNTEAEVRAALAAQGVNFDSLTDEVKAQVLNGLAQMSDPKASAGAAPKPKSAAKKTPAVAPKNRNEVVIEIAELRGKGYPAPVNLDTGAGRGK